MKVIYLILDTNTWIYLANSKDPSTENFHEGLHFKLFEKLSQKVKDGSVQILTNDIIENEWNRNKQHTSDLVNKYKHKLTNDLAVVKNIQTTLNGKFDGELTKIKTEYQDNVNAKIAENEAHILNVEKLLSASIKFEVTSETKSFAADWAVEKKAPFRGEKKNSMADALILFSAIEYIKKISTIEIFDMPFINLETSIFVSGNKGDFCSTQNGDKIHEDLESQLNDVQMGFYKSLPLALNFIDDTLFKDAEIRKIEMEMEELYDEDTCYCDICSPDSENQYLNIIYFSNPEEIVNENDTIENPNQLKLELGNITPTNGPKRKITNAIQRGFCSWCNTEHIKCQNCSEITALSEDIENEFECEGCGLIYQIDNEYLGSGMFEQSIKIVSAKPDIEDTEEYADPK